MGWISFILDFWRTNPSLLLVILLFIGYSIYYLFYVVKKPHLACYDKEFRHFLNNHVPILHEKFWPTFWCFESRAQTILRSILQSTPAVFYESENFCLPDGGQVKLDWVHNNEGNSLHPDTKTRPTIVLLPGLTGTSEEPYILHLVTEAVKLGYRIVVFNNRGNGTKLLTARTYCAANTEDLSLVVSHVRASYPDAPLMGAGVSLGGMILLQYLIKSGQDCVLSAAFCVSTAWNVFESVTTLEKPGLNKHVINWMCTKGLVDNFRENMHLFESHLEDAANVLKSTTIREFDHHFTAPMFGYSGWQDYYTDACLHDKVHALGVPVLCVNAADDPFSPHHAIPIDEAERNDNIAILVTSRGGHIGFMEGLIPKSNGYIYRMFSQYVKGVFTHGPKKTLKTE